MITTNLLTTGTRGRWIVYGLVALLLAACGESADPPAAKAAKRAPKPALVAAQTVRSEQLALTQVRTGTLHARRTVRLHSQEEGRILALPVFEGDRVAAGDLLVRLDDRLLRAEINKAQANLRQASDDLARIKRLAGRQLVSADELSRAETQLRVAESEVSLLQTRLGYTEIRAPFAGIVSRRSVEPGDAVPRFAHLLTLIDPQSLITQVSVSELLLPSLQQDKAVEVSIDALGETHYTGRIERIHPTVDPQTRQGIVEIVLDPVPPGAQAGQLCRVYLPGEIAARRLIPLAALRRDQEGDYVYVIDAEQTARRTPVRSGRAFADDIEILAGLNDGDRVITRGFIDITDGKAVQVIDPNSRSSTSPP